MIYKKVQKDSKKNKNDKVFHQNFERFCRRRLKKWDDVFADIKVHGFEQSERIEKNVEVALGASGEILLIDGSVQLLYGNVNLIR